MVYEELLQHAFFDLMLLFDLYAVQLKMQLK